MEKMATLNNQERSAQDLDFASYLMELNFTSEDAKRLFLLRAENTKQGLAPRGSLPLDNCELLSSFLDMAEATPPTNQPDGLTTCITGDLQHKARQFLLYL